MRGEVAWAMRGEVAWGGRGERPGVGGVRGHGWEG